VSTEAVPADLLDRVQELSEQVDALPDPRARELAQELVGAVIAMYGDGLRRIMAAISGARGAGETILDQLMQDGAVASLLLIHDLYPVPLDERVREALDTVRPYMESHGGNVELLGIDDGVATLALRGSCNGCAASRATLELAIKQALEEHAPDLAGLEVQGVSEPPRADGAFELPVVNSGGSHAELPITGELPMVNAQPPRWVPLEIANAVRSGEVRPVRVDGAGLLLANVAGSLLAYRDTCASCGEPLHDGELVGTMLRCRRCDVEFDLPRAGRAAGAEPLQLTPVPLLEAGGVRVAV
jgi:Fe-S cluster biogenesis protein NfuA/nitrite reductase/ring-hydroxylating ferredoxin subunit